MAKPILDVKRPEIGAGKAEIGAIKPEINSIAAGEQRPNFESLFGAPPAERIPNPLDRLDLSDDPEEAAEQEVSAALQHILDEKKKRRDAYRDMLDHEFWFAICFQNRRQKDEFLKAVGWDKIGDKYLDGLKVAAALEVPIEPVNLPVKDVRPAPVILRDEENFL